MRPSKFLILSIVPIMAVSPLYANEDQQEDIAITPIISDTKLPEKNIRQADIRQADIRQADIRQADIAQNAQNIAPKAVLLQSFPQVGIQKAAPPQVASSDFLLLGIGAGFSTDYSGADNYDFLPTPLVIGRYKGIDFATRGPGVTVDLIRDTRGDKVDYILGPLLRFRFDRNNADNIEDAQVAALEELDTALELGVSAGVKINRIFSGFDDITVMVDAQADVLGAHGGFLIAPTITYSTPFSAGIVARLSAGISYASNDFVDTYSSINAANSAASGLAEFTGEGGIRDANTSLLLAYDLSGDVRDGGWGLFAIGSYSRLLSDTARSPIVTETGTPNQFFGAIGIGYSF